MGPCRQASPICVVKRYSFCKTIETSILNVNGNSFPGLVTIGKFDKRAPGLFSYVKGKPRPQGAFPWLWRWAGRGW